MLPTGHIAGGYLTVHALIKVFKPELDNHQLNQLLLAGVFFGFAPDVDEFWFFLKNKSWLVAPDGAEKHHRTYFTHAPLVWLITGLAIYVVGPTEFLRWLGLVVWLAAWSHFVLDSFEYGVMWLWPVSHRLYAFKNAGRDPLVIKEKNFFKHSLKFLWGYTKRISFYLEILIILAAISIYL